MSPVSSPLVKPRLIQLDILRGVAILLVLAVHFPGGWPGADSWLRFVPSPGRGGWVGVDLFFVLSGFLIGGLIFKEIKTTGRFDTRRFLVRRAWRIWPSYYAFVAVFFAFWCVVHSPAKAWKTWLPNLLHLQNYVVNEKSARPHTWSLAVEEHFYLLLILAMWLLIGRYKTPDLSKLAWVGRVGVGILVGCLAARFLVAQNATRPQFDAIHFVTHLRLDTLLFGVLLAYLEHFHPARLRFVGPHAGKLLLGGVLLLVPAFYISLPGFFLQTVGYLLVYLGCGAIVLAFVHAPQAGKWTRFWHSRAANMMATIGFFSYPIYLWHRDVAIVPTQWIYDHAFWADWPFRARWVAVFGIYLILAVGGGAFWYYAWEKPILKFRDRRFPLVRRLWPRLWKKSHHAKKGVFRC